MLERDFPGTLWLLYNQSVLALSSGKTKAGKEYSEKYRSVRIEMSASEAALASSMGYIYRDAGIMDKAEEYLRQALSLEPENPVRLNNVAYFLVDSERNVDEGIELIEKAAELGLDKFYYAECKGWGFYKQGKYTEALDLLQKAWTLKPVYNHEVFLHLEAAKKAVAGQKIK